MLKTVMHVESYVKISRCVENVYVRRVENHIENRVEVRKKHHHTLQHMLKLSGRFKRYFTIQMFRIFNFVKFLKRSTPDAHLDD